jgi:hypothetical protein
MGQAHATVLPFLIPQPQFRQEPLTSNGPHTDLDLLYKTWWVLAAHPEMAPILDQFLDDLIVS